MRSFVDVGESVSGPVSEPDQGAARVGAPWTGAWGAIGSVGLVGAYFLNATNTPFFRIDAVLVFALALAPALLIGAIFVLWDSGRLPVLDRMWDGKPIAAAMFVGLYIILIPSPYLLYLNQRLDGSPATVETARVTRSYETAEGNYYYADVASLTRSPLGAFSIYGGSQPIELGGQDFARVVPGRTRFVLRAHRGFFHIPWYEPKPLQLD